MKEMPWTRIPTLDKLWMSESILLQDIQVESENWERNCEGLDGLLSHEPTNVHGFSVLNSNSDENEVLAPGHGQFVRPSSNLIHFLVGSCVMTDGDEDFIGAMKGLWSVQLVLPISMATKI